MRDLSFAQAASCENAKHPRCKCRCGGAAHGARRAGQEPQEDWVEVKDPEHPEETLLVPPRNFFEELPADDPHHLPTEEEVKTLRPRWRKELKAKELARERARAWAADTYNPEQWEKVIQDLTARIAELRDLLGLEPETAQAPVQAPIVRGPHHHPQACPEDPAEAPPARTPAIGEVWCFQRACMGNPAGEPALCYEEYTLGGRPGWSFIFPNGAHDGFSPGDLALFGGQYRGTAARYQGYTFRNVTQLLADYRRGYFTQAFALYPNPERLEAQIR